MQRLFSGFPSGSPGVGLLILRLMLAGHLSTEGSASVVLAVELGGSSSIDLMVQAALALVGALIAAGFLTPVVLTPLAVMLASFSGLRVWSLLPGITPGTFWSSGVIDAAISAGLALLGPGAYSIDARLFGRQEVVIPRRIPPSVQ